jgi:Fur family iron response transcriptional regulator
MNGSSEPRRGAASPRSEVVSRRLAQAGLRPTRQRAALAGILFASFDRHVTAELLHAEATAAGEAVSLATVYNTLHQFTAAGLLREVVVEPGRSYFDTNTEDHHHFYHERTGDLQDIDADSVVVAAIPQAPAGTRVSRIDVVIRLADG